MNMTSILMANRFTPTSGAISPMASSDGETESRRSETSKEVDDIMGKDAFLRLLTTQLRYQDPMKPVDDQDFIAQLAQFSALEQMQNLTRTMEAFIAEERATNQLARATALLGRNAVVMTESGTLRGRVEGFVLEDGVPWLVIDGRAFSVSDVIHVEAE